MNENTVLKKATNYNNLNNDQEALLTRLKAKRNHHKNQSKKLYLTETKETTCSNSDIPKNFNKLKEKSKLFMSNINLEINNNENDFILLKTFVKREENKIQSNKSDKF